LQFPKLFQRGTIVNKKISIILMCCVFSFSQAAEIKELCGSNGIKFWFMRDDSAPLVHVRIAFKNAGASHQKKEQIGLPTFYTYGVFCGSGKYSRVQFIEECSNLSIQIISKADMDNIVFSLTSPKIVLNEAINLFNALLGSPNFEEGRIKMLQNDLACFFYDYAASPIGVAVFLFVPSMIFKSHFYENGKYGSLEDFQRLSIEDLKNYKSKFLVTSNVEMCVFGDISENEAIALVDKIFNGIPKGQAAIDNVKDTVPQLDAEIKKYYVEGPQSTVCFALKTETPLSPKRCIARILCRIIGEGGTFKGRILSKLRTEMGLIYSGTAFCVDHKHASYIFGGLQTDNSKVQDAIESIKLLIKDLRENGITESELQFAKNNIKGSILVNLRTSGDLCNFYFTHKLLGYPKTILKDYIEKLEKITLEEVNAYAKEILDADNIPFLVIGGEKK